MRILRRTWTAVLGAILLIGSSTAARPAWAHAASDPLGTSWTSFCETSQAYGKICGTLTRRGDTNIWDAKWTNNAVGVFTVSLSDHTVTAQRSDPRGASA